MFRFCTIFILIFNTCLADNTIDSLRSIAKNASLQDIERIKANYELSNIDDENLMEGYCLTALELLSKLDSTGKNKDDYNNYKGSTLGNLGYYYRTKGLISKALDKYFSALKYAELNNNKNLYADMKNNIGMLYYSQKQYREAIPYYLKAIEVYKELKQKEYEARTYMNAAGAFQNLNNYSTSVNYFKKALGMFVELKDTFYIAFAYNNLAVCYKKFDMSDSSFVYLDKALKLFTAMNAEDELAWTYDIYGGVYTGLKQFQKAEPYCLKCVTIAEKRNLPSQLASCLDNLYLINKEKGDYKNALKYFYRADSIQDSLVNNDTRLLLAKNQVMYDYSKKEEAIKLDSEKKEIQFKEDQKRTNLILISVSFILLISVAFGYLIYKSFKSEKASKLMAEKQKEIIEEKQKEIIESITYAKRLQEAILPAEEYINNNLPNNFVLYKPKDIVAGDFYWMHVDETNNKIFIAAADSTGHGVPGALVSVVCSNALNRTVKEFDLKDTGHILDKTRELVLETFEKSTSEVKDGMDISLLCIDQKNQKIFWSGANNSLMYLTKLNNVKELHIIKADKQPIGKTEYPKPFTSHEIEYLPDTIFYLITDGYADQFGGEKGKKFKQKQLQDVLIDISDLPLEVQKQKLEVAFLNWKSDLEQVDDVTIIGVKI